MVGAQVEGVLGRLAAGVTALVMVAVVPVTTAAREEAAVR